VRSPAVASVKVCMAELAFDRASLTDTVKVVMPPYQCACDATAPRIERQPLRQRTRYHLPRVGRCTVNRDERRRVCLTDPRIRHRRGGNRHGLRRDHDGRGCGACAWGDDESRTVTRIVKVPCLSGWPAIVPDDASKPRPAGSDPDAIVHVYGPSPPLTVSDPAYGNPRLRRVDRSRC